MHMIHDPGVQKSAHKGHCCPHLVKIVKKERAEVNKIKVSISSFDERCDASTQ